MNNSEEWRQPQPQPQPILVVLVWRGGPRFQRALDSIRGAEQYFKRIILSVTSAPDSDDLKVAHQFIRDSARDGNLSRAEILCTEVELPTMQHQAFWINYLLESGASPDDWIYWLAYDDQLFLEGIESVVNNEGEWPLEPHTGYLGPWAMRHESANELWQGDCFEPTEIWTSMPLDQPTALDPITWTLCQLLHPTYIQMSGSVLPLSTHMKLVAGVLHKRLPMRIEMASIINCRRIDEFPVPVVIIYGRPNSDRSNYGSAARREDIDLFIRLTKILLKEPRRFVRCIVDSLKLSKIAGKSLWSREEEWRVRGTI